MKFVAFVIFIFHGPLKVWKTREMSCPICAYNFHYQNFGKSPLLEFVFHKNTLSKLDKILERIYAVF